MKTKFTLFFAAFILVFGSLFGKEIPINEASTVAKNFIYEHTGIKQSTIVLSETTISNNNNNIYYVFNIDKGGFVLVAAEDNFSPIIGYSFKNKFETENQPANLQWWLNQYVEEIEYTRENNIKANNSDLWNIYNVSFAEFLKTTSPNSKEVIVEPLTGEILWDQGAGWNEFCPEDADGAGGHVYAGCVATAMGIVMKYWEYPIAGSNSHSYYAGSYGTLTANFGNTNYMWELMDNNSANDYSALLLFHLGVSVDMGYSADGSGAFSFDVPYALEHYFDYNTSAQYISKSSYSNSSWLNLLKGQLDADKPVYYSGRDDDNGGHAFVCDGYDDTDNFHFNFGWSGISNGFYILGTDGVGGFYNDQSAVINIEPDAAYFPYNTNAPNNLVAELDPELTDFTVNLSWEAPSTKALIGYNLYRDDEMIEEGLTTTTFSYTDDAATPENHYYGVRAIYDEGISQCAVDNVKGLFQVVFKVYDTYGGSGIHLANVTFNGQDKTTGFGSAYFNNTPFGSNYDWSVSYTGYETQTGTLDFLNQDTEIYVYMDGSVAIPEIKNDQTFFPNPTTGNIQLSGLDIKNRIRIFDVNGKLVYEQKNVQNKSEINLSFLNKGIYIVNISSKNETTNKKLIIQ